MIKTYKDFLNELLHNEDDLEIVINNFIDDKFNIIIVAGSDGMNKQIPKTNFLCATLTNILLYKRIDNPSKEKLLEFIQKNSNTTLWVEDNMSLEEQTNILRSLPKDKKVILLTLEKPYTFFREFETISW